MVERGHRFQQPPVGAAHPRDVVVRAHLGHRRTVLSVLSVRCRRAGGHRRLIIDPPRARWCCRGRRLPTLAAVACAPVTEPGAIDLAALVGRAASGDQRAYDVIVDRFAGLVWRIAQNHRLRPADAADVSQTVWLRLVEQLDRIREPERLGAWLATTARNECLAVLRKGAKALPAEEATFESLAAAHLGTTPAVDAERLEADDRRRAVREAFAALDERCQSLLSLLTTDPPASYDEIAAALAMPIGSIGPTRQRCLGKLRSHPALVRISGDPGDSDPVRS